MLGQGFASYVGAGKSEVYEYDFIGICGSCASALKLMRAGELVHDYVLCRGVSRLNIVNNLSDI